MKLGDLIKEGKFLGYMYSEKSDKKYEIRELENGKLTCNCIGFLMRKKCRHTIKWEEK